MDLLRPATGRSVCEFKGVARYGTFGLEHPEADGALPCNQGLCRLLREPGRPVLRRRGTR
jgi:hypothetical protein